MRSQILPPALCLLLAVMFAFNPAYSAINNLKVKSKTTDNKPIKSLNSDTYYFNISDINQHKDATNKSESAVIVSPKPEVLSLDKNHSIEENSYKYNVTIPVGNTASLEENKIEEVSTPSLFRQGMFYGFTLMVILLNLVCFFLFEEKIFMFYSFALTAFTATFMFSDMLFPELGINGIENMGAMQSTLLLVATVCGALFASKYLSLEEFFPKLKWISASLIALAFMMIFSGWIAETNFYTGIANTTLIAVMTLYFSAAVLLFSKKNYAKFYVIAYAIPLLFALDFFVLRKIGVEFLFTENFHLKAAAIVEMLIVTYAIMYRMRAIKEEHLLRQTEMRIFLKRQEVLNRTNTEKIMQDIYLENLIMQYDLDGLEIKLLQYISEGKDNVKIARKLRTTEIEIEALTKDLYDKLEISEQIQDDYRMVDTQPDYIYN